MLKVISCWIFQEKIPPYRLTFTQIGIDGVLVHLALEIYLNKCVQTCIWNFNYDSQTFNLGYLHIDACQSCKNLVFKKKLISGILYLEWKSKILHGFSRRIFCSVTLPYSNVYTILNIVHASPSSDDSWLCNRQELMFS